MITKSKFILLLVSVVCVLLLTYQHIVKLPVVQNLDPNILNINFSNFSIKSIFVTDDQPAERRVLATMMMLPKIALLNTSQTFRLYSAVPVRSQDTFTGASLALIGDNKVTVNDTYGRHFIR